MNQEQLLEAAEEGRLDDVARALTDQVAIDCVNDQQRTPLLVAAKAGHKTVVQLLIEQGADVHAIDLDGKTALMLAADEGHKLVVQLLLDAGAATDARSEEEQYTALMMAAIYGHDEILELLIDRGASVNAVDKNEWTPLMLAIQNGQTSTARVLMDRGATLEMDPAGSYTALMVAGEEGNDELVQELIDRGAGVNSRSEDGDAALHAAAGNGHEDTVKLLLELGASVNATSNDNQTALMLAAENGHLNVAQMLINAGADVNVQHNTTKWTSLSWAVDGGHTQIVKLLLDSGATTEARSEEEQYTALMMAAMYGHDEILELLIDRGASVNAVDKNEWTPLMLAIQNGQTSTARVLMDRGATLEMDPAGSYTALMVAGEEGNDELVQELIDRGAGVNFGGKLGFTPLHIAAEHGHVRTAQLLLDLGASPNATAKDKRTPLILAGENGRDDVAQVLIDRGAEVNARDENRWTSLMWAAQEGHEQVVEVLIKAGARVNAKAKDKQTTLMLAAQNGHEATVRTLVKHGASIDATNDNGQTALILASSEGHTYVVEALLKERAALSEMDKNDEVALMYAIDNNHPDIVRELLRADSYMNDAMKLLKLGLKKRRDEAAMKEKTKAEVKIEDLVQLCSKMNEAQAISDRIYSRFVNVEKEISTLSELIKQEATPRFKQLLEKTHGFLIKHADKHTVTRLVGSQVMIDTSRDLNRELDAFLLQFNLPCEASGVHDWKEQWNEDSASMKSFLKDSLKKKDVLMNELQDPVAQAEALTLLMFECNTNASQYYEEEMTLINELFQYVSSMSRLEIPAVPQWFVPPHEVQFNAKSSFAGGSYGSVHYGTWNGTAVVVKSAFLEDDKSREMFLNETEIWFKLQHPHIVTLFRACHIGNPFFVCDLASNGTLSEYLYRDKNHFETWAKLHQAALGLQYLHTKQKVVHGDLKCNNILISADGKAKLTDFGLSFVWTDREEEEGAPSNEVGAIRWKAPEIMNGKTRGTFASDVYSFGMCIVEAVTGRVPWGMMPDVAVKHKTLSQKELPKQPSDMNDAQWDLVKRMCAWNPADRIDISEAVKTLSELAEEELDLKMEAEWAEDEDNEPISEPDPMD